MPDAPTDELLDQAQLSAALLGLPAWSGDATGIRRTVEAPSFPQAIALVAEVGVAAEEADHHPDIDIRWRTVTFFLTTHSAGGVTAKDVALAARIDQFASFGG